MFIMKFTFNFNFFMGHSKYVVQVICCLISHSKNYTFIHEIFSLK